MYMGMGQTLISAGDCRRWSIMVFELLNHVIKWVATEIVNMI